MVGVVLLALAATASPQDGAVYNVDCRFEALKGASILRGQTGIGRVIGVVEASSPPRTHNIVLFSGATLYYSEAGVSIAPRQIAWWPEESRLILNFESGERRFSISISPSDTGESVAAIDREADGNRPGSCRIEPALVASESIR